MGKKPRYKRRLILGRRCPRCRKKLTAKTYRLVKRKSGRWVGICLICAAETQRQYRLHGHNKVEPLS